MLQTVVKSYAEGISKHMLSTNDCMATKTGRQSQYIGMCPALHALMKKRGMTIRQLVGRSGIAEPTLEAYFNGKRQHTDLQSSVVARILGAMEYGWGELEKVLPIESVLDAIRAESHSAAAVDRAELRRLEGLGGPAHRKTKRRGSKGT